MTHLWTALHLSLPVIIAGILHMVVVRLNLLSSLAKPIHEEWFGRNKTWRGALVMPALTVSGVAVTLACEGFLRAQGSSVSFESRAWLIGLAFGVAYVLAELPNSYLKRRMGIAPGQTPRHNRLLFAFVDQADSVAGCLVAALCVLHVPMISVLLVLALGPGLHLLLNALLYGLGLRRSPL